MTFPSLPIDWQTVLTSEYEKPYWQQLTKRVTEGYLTSTVYPEESHLFRAFALCPLQSVRVVILGQDPYHREGQADGLAFSVQSEVAIPPSLRNIYKEITADVGAPADHSGELTRLATQGVLLLNTTLTVFAGAPASHATWGWEQFTNSVITTISDQKEHIVFLLWGKHAQAKQTLIDQNKHLVLMAPHPSPLSAYHGFFGCRHFSKTNEYLHQHAQPPIAW